MKWQLSHPTKREPRRRGARGAACCRQGAPQLRLGEGGKQRQLGVPISLSSLAGRNNIKECRVRLSFQPSSCSPATSICHAVSSPFACVYVSLARSGQLKARGPTLHSQSPALAYSRLCRRSTARFSTTDPGLCSPAEGSWPRDQATSSQ